MWVYSPRKITALVHAQRLRGLAPKKAKQHYGGVFPGSRGSGLQRNCLLTTASLLFFFFLKQYLLKFGPITRHIKWFQISAWLLTIERLAKFSSTQHDHSRCFKALAPSAQEGYYSGFISTSPLAKRKKKRKNQKNLTIPQSHSSCVQAAVIVG